MVFILPPYVCIQCYWDCASPCITLNVNWHVSVCLRPKPLIIGRCGIGVACICNAACGIHSTTPLRMYTMLLGLYFIMYHTECELTVSVCIRPKPLIVGHILGPKDHKAQKMRWQWAGISRRIESIIMIKHGGFTLTAKWYTWRIDQI